MSEFHDPDLRQELSRLSGTYPDDNAAFAQWQRRLGFARRRRAVAWATGAALSLMVATVGVAALQSPDRHTLVPAESAETSDEPTSNVATTEAADDSSTAEITRPQSTMPVATSPETATVIVEATAAGGDQPDNTVGNQAGSPVTPASAASSTKVINSVGGSITVQQDGNQLTVVAATPAAGFETSDIPHPGESLEVRFKSSDHESRITVRLIDGVIRSSVSEDTEGHDTTVPDGSSGQSGDGGGGKGSD
jgi:hypothetical protein